MKKKTYLFMLAVVCTAMFALTGCGDGEATEEEAAADGGITVTVEASAQQDGKYTVPYQEVEVDSALAEQYGLTDRTAADTAVSALDVMVRLHEIAYGDDFTADTCGNYLAVDNGWISMAFETKTSSWSVLFNGESAHSDAESSYGGFEALEIDETKIADGDSVEIVAYQDTENYSDSEVWFLMSDGSKPEMIEAAVNEEVTLNLQGYAFSMYGAYGTDAIVADYLAPMDGLQLAILDKDGTINDIEGAITDANGNVTFFFESAGEGYLVAYTPADAGSKSFIAAVAVSVK